MRPAATVATLAVLAAALLSVSGHVVAAARQVPRMERVATCSWDRPGHNAFMGDVVAAIDRYTEIPTPVRMRLKQRMQARQYDDLVEIRRDEIRGRARYEPAIRDMHFGVDRVCRQVSRAGWTAQMKERGLVYCEAGHCILVPTVCRNVSRIERQPATVAKADVGGAPAEGDRAAVPPPAAIPTVDAGNAGAIASAPPTTALSLAEVLPGARTEVRPVGSDALIGGMAGGHTADNAAGGGAAGRRGGTSSLWPLVGGSWSLGSGASGGGFGGLVNGLVQSGAKVVPCLAHSGDRGRHRIASGWRVATGGRPARLAERRRDRSGPRPSFRRRLRRHAPHGQIARPRIARARRLTLAQRFVHAFQRVLQCLGIGGASDLAAGRPPPPRQVVGGPRRWHLPCTESRRSA